MAQSKTIKFLPLMLGIISFSIAAHAEEKSSDISTAMKEFSAPNISSFIRQVWQKTPQVLEAEASMKAARAQAAADSKWRYNPEIEFDGEDTDGAKKTKIFGVSQTIDWSGKFLAAGEVAKYELQAATAQRDNIRQIVALDVLSALSDYQAAKEILALSSERTKLMERFSILAKKSFKAGDIDQSEYNLAQLAFSEALIQHADSQTMLGESEMVLKSLLGFSDIAMKQLPTLPDELPTIAINDKTTEQIIEKLPAIRILQAQAQASKAAISRANRERVPDPTVNLRGGSNEGEDIIGLSVSIPLNIFNSYANEVDVAKYQTTAQEQSLFSAFYAAKSRLDFSRKAYELSSHAWSVWKENGAQALEKQIDTLDRKFKVGELSATDYLVQVRQSINTEIAANELHNKAWKSWFAWLGASGNIKEWLGEK